ncbi:MAG: hypothetical protein H0T53_00340 [Herpetosiphonaceae bacterium]|nr:hypothetical protein [Herpetosiphonaceae bacterium]
MSDEKRHTRDDDPVDKNFALDPQRPHVPEVQPDTFQPDVQNLTDMAARPGNEFQDAADEREDDAQRQHILEKKLAE